MSDLNDPRVFFAADRTLLAWTRTGITLMGFGFVIERFGLLFLFRHTVKFALFRSRRVKHNVRCYQCVSELFFSQAAKSVRLSAA
ncbi:MAG: DUF202 domain-containing protein [Deltaproteobacteria bacterium]|nr:DUF202 domain-containing protein [Deltaproteobacteria bacterium]